MEKKPVSNIVKGLIIAAILIVLDLLGATSFLKSASWFVFVPTIALVLLCALNVIHYCSELKGNVKFGDAFAFGFKTAAIVALVMVLYTFISLKYVHPEFKEKAYQEALTGYQQQPNIMPDEAKTQARNYADNFTMISVSRALMSTLIVSAVGSAIGAALAKRKQ